MAGVNHDEADRHPPGCLSIDEIAAGRESAPAQRSHLDECESCRERLNAVRRDAQTLARLRGAISSPVSDSTGVTFQPPPLPSNLIHGYTLLEEISRGSQGVVYKAIQERTRRTVAVKMLLGGLFATEKQRARFEREIEIVASLGHPGIVTIFDSTPVNGGRYAYATEFFEGGLPIDAWSKSITGDAKTVRRAKLSLFAEVCDAVHYAHQRGVIHRDLKPGNVLVDPEARPHVLDFGIAKVVGTPSASQTLTGEIVGSPAYASPEQLSGHPDAVDVRSDVYSLGVILYEMLSGNRPHDTRDQPLAKTVRDITERDATRLGLVDRALRGDLETIAAKALARDKGSRYQSADALSADVRRYLAGGAIHARRTSPWYRIRKAVARHKLAAGLGIALAGVLVAATIVSLAFAANARIAREDTADALGRERERTSLLEREAYTGHIFAAQESLDAMDAAGVAASLERARQAAPELRGWEWDFLTAQVNRSTWQIHWEWNSMLDADLSADGRWGVQCSHIGEVLVWELERSRIGVLRPVSGGQPAALRAARVAVSPDGELIAVALESDDSIRLLRRHDGEMLPIAMIGRTPVTDVDFSQDGGRIVVARSDGSRQLWDTRTGALIRRFQESIFFFGTTSMAASAVAMPADGKRVVTAFDNGWIVMRDCESGEWLWQKRADGREMDVSMGAAGMQVHSVAISDDGAIVASGHRDGSVRLWRGSTGKPIGVLRGHRGRDLDVTFVPGTHDVLTGAGDGLVRWWDGDAGVLRRTFLGLTSSVQYLACSRTSPVRVLAAGAWPASNAWRLDAPDDVLTLSHDGKAVYGAVFSPIDGSILTVADEFRVRRWNANTGALIEEFTEPGLPSTELAEVYKRNVLSMRGIAAANAGGDELVATTHENGAVKLWNNSRFRATLATPLAIRNGESAGPTFCVNNTLLLASFDLRAAVWWNLATLQPEIVPFPGESFHSCAMSPGGETLAVLQRDGRLSIIDLGARDAPPRTCSLAMMETIARAPLIMSFSPDGTRLAVPNGMTVSIVDMRTLKATACTGHTADVNSARFSPDGSRVVSASVDGTVRLWDARTGDRRLVLRRHERGVLDAAFSPDGRRLVSCGEDGLAFVWCSEARGGIPGAGEKRP